MRNVVILNTETLMYVRLTMTGFATAYNGFDYVEYIHHATIFSHTLSEVPVGLRKSILATTQHSLLPVRVTRTVELLD